MYPTSPKSHIYWLLPLPLGSSFSKAVSWAIVLILPPIKLNSQLSHCDFFPSWQRHMGGPTGMATRDSLWVLENSSFPWSRQLPSMLCVGRIIPKLDVSVLFVLAYTSLGEVGHYKSKVEWLSWWLGLSVVRQEQASLPGEWTSVQVIVPSLMTFFWSIGLNAKVCTDCGQELMHQFFHP